MPRICPNCKEKIGISEGFFDQDTLMCHLCRKPVFPPNMEAPPTGLSTVGWAGPVDPDNWMRSKAVFGPPLLIPQA